MPTAVRSHQYVVDVKEFDNNLLKKLESDILRHPKIGELLFPTDLSWIYPGTAVYIFTSQWENEDFIALSYYFNSDTNQVRFLNAKMGSNVLELGPNSISKLILQLAVSDYEGAAFGKVLL